MLSPWVLCSTQRVYGSLSVLSYTLECLFFRRIGLTLFVTLFSVLCIKCGMGLSKNFKTPLVGAGPPVWKYLQLTADGVPLPLGVELDVPDVSQRVPTIQKVCYESSCWRFSPVRGPVWGIVHVRPVFRETAILLMTSMFDERLKLQRSRFCRSFAQRTLSIRVNDCRRSN